MKKRLTTIAASVALTLTMGQAAWAGGSVHVGAGYRGGHHGYHGGYGYRGGYGHHGSSDAGVALLFGMLFGGLIGYAISEDRQQRQYQYRRYEQANTQPRLVTHQPQAPIGLGPCVQTREYTTILNIEGHAKEAYGTRCLKPDGTWVFGPPKLVPEF